MGEWLKICIISLVIFSFLPWNAIAAQMEMEPPGVETGKNILNKTGSTTKSFLTSIGRGIGDIIDRIAPLIRNGDEIVGNWWREKAKPWFLERWEGIRTYLSKEIIIN